MGRAQRKLTTKPSGWHKETWCYAHPVTQWDSHPRNTPPAAVTVTVHCANAAPSASIISTTIPLLLLLLLPLLLLLLLKVQLPLNTYVVHFELYVKYLSEICGFESVICSCSITQKCMCVWYIVNSLMFNYYSALCKCSTYGDILLWIINVYYCLCVMWS